MQRQKYLAAAAPAATWLGLTFSLPSFAQDSVSAAKPNILFLRTFQEFPPRQKPGSFSIDQAMEKLMQRNTSN